MTADQLRQLESKLWTASDQLRANSKLTATEYSFPVLGLIFLRHAFNRFKTAEAKIMESLPVHPQRGRRPVAKEDFLQAKAIFLADRARWDYIAGLPEGEDVGEAIDEAMRSIERDYEVLEGVLPKNYSIFEKQLLHKLLRIFNTEMLDGVTGDVFGRIYEYFLNKFAMTGAQEGGEFFTPPSLVNAIVNIIEPKHGIVLDCACGSAGMFVQTGHFLEEEGFDPASKVTFYGQEKADTNTKLAKMNMTVHGLDASILQGNTFYEDKHGLAGKCDFVMANPPFNVDGVDKSRDYVKNDPRLPFGLPKSDNANYLWIQYFYGYLNEKGRAGFVMASSASDAGHSEKSIREKLVETGAVDVMVSIGTKFFYTRSLPCTLWFFDRAKERDPKRAGQTLMLDLREVYRKVSSNLHDFTEEHLKNIHAIVGLYRGNAAYYQKTLAEYRQKIDAALLHAQRIWERLGEIPGLELETDAVSLDGLKNRKRHLNNAVKTYTQQNKDELRANSGRRGDMQDRLAKADALAREYNEWADEALHFHRELHWLSSRFPDARYADVPGLCKIATRAEIAANDYSLTPGRYVGVASQMDDGFDYEERMAEIKVELQTLNEEAVELARVIQENLNEMGL
ncbi:MAG: SAM-dependent DNA methyltransferase [Saprospirales bacterium]|nr:SAM-dependent DNA methyltransferase [Saprospirales bacterium]